MSRKIVGVTVGTPIGISAIKEKLNPVTSVNGVEADENGNVEITIPDSGGSIDLTDYIELLPESTYPVSEDMGIVEINREVTFIAGKTYLVNWNGVDYVRVAHEGDEVVILGENEDPFSVESYPNGADIYVNDGSESVTLAIYEKIAYATEEWVEEKLKEHSGGIAGLVVTVKNKVASHSSDEILAHIRSGGTAALYVHERLCNFHSYDDIAGVVTFMWQDQMEPEWYKFYIVSGYNLQESEEYTHISRTEITGATVGQIAMISEVDDDGVPTAWTPVDLPSSGGNADQVSVEPAEDDMPKVFITGVKPTTKDDVLAEMQYISKTDNFHAYLEIKCQGTSSMSYPKKNFTVKLYSDEARETKLKKDFKDWNHPGNKFVLKANYIDHSHARNIVSARLWGEVVASRPDYDSLPEEMRNAPNNGAVDGFPIKVYYNGNYEGVYTWNIGKDDWQWGMDEDNPNHVLMCAESNVSMANPCNFNELWNGVHESNWSVEVGTNSTALKNSLNNLIQFVMDNDGSDFKNGIGNYLDIQSAIDYYIFQYEICGLDGLAKNMLLATYDGTKWICGAYDMDSTFGLFWNGGKFVSATYACPEDYQAKASLLWERIEANYMPELKARQAELRKTVLSYSNMVTHFERFMDVIGLDLYAEDLTIYTGIPSGTTNNIKQIRNFIRDRQAYVDAEFAAMSDPVHCTGISLNTNTLNFTAEGTQTLTATVTPDGCTDAVTWESNNTSVATVNGGVVTAIANGSAMITARCGEYSATCSVAVSGIAEPVACTGISLDKTELAFDGEGAQIITATVTPSDTTDTVVWVSSDPAVAAITVEGNVCTVQSVSNGDATITVTCGNHSASCAVSVSGLGIDYTLNALTDVTWTLGNRVQDTGEDQDATDCHRSSKFSLQNCAYTLPTTGITSRLYMWNENGDYIGVIDNINSARTFVARSDYQYALTVYSTDTAVLEAFTCMPKQNAIADTLEIDLSALTWVGSQTTKCEVTLTYNVPVATANKSNYFIWDSTNSGSHGTKKDLLFGVYNNKTLILYGYSAAEANAYFAENPTKLILN